ncbi:hypothetical protein WBG78_26620 [Chryseolinea sp. T2]|uniref:hypothetical protein n=1 Tax=Chryseolinea sp. T2 TaxID=3129255 RepID=UPI003078078B
MLRPLSMFGSLKSLVAFLLFLNVNCYAQHITVSIADTTHFKDSLRVLEQKHQDVLQKTNKVSSELQKLQEVGRATSVDDVIPDTIQSAITTGTEFLKHRVYSEKHLAAIRDSIERALGRPLPGNLPLKKEMSPEEMLDALNQKFPGAGEHRFTNDLGSVTEDSLKSQVPYQDRFPDLHDYKISADHLKDMVPLPGSIVKSKYLRSIDSLRSINLKEEKLKYKEKAVSQHAKLSKFQQRPTFKERSYFEGIVGLITGKSLTIYSASPALGYHFVDNFSLGAGPNLQVIAVDRDIKFNGGIRAFSKIEFWKRQLYVQIEDSMNPWSPKDERIQVDKHNVMVGGGVLLSVKAPVTLNFSMLYNLTENKTTISDISPFVFRIGISTVKVEK